MRPTHEIKAAIIAAHGKEPARALASRFGLTRNQVIGIWYRRPHDTTPQAEAEAAPAAVAETRSWPDTADISGTAGAAWRALLAAGDRGATRDLLIAAMTRSGDLPSTWDAVQGTLRKLRSIAEPNGYTVSLVDRTRPSRWRIQHTGKNAVPLPPAAAADLARPIPTPNPVAPALVSLELPIVAQEPVLMSGLSGAAAALEALRRGCCKWPFGEPNSPSFRFCSEAVQDEGKPYCREHRRQASGGLWSAKKAA